MEDFQIKCKKFNINRVFYSGDIHENRINAYIKNINDFDVNTSIPEHGQNIIRIMSWNVRYFTDVHDKPSSKKIFDTIIKFNPDVVCFQEFTLGKNRYDPSFEFYDNYKIFCEIYQLISVCSAVPSWYADLYGNAVYMKIEFIEKIKNSDERNDIFKYLCQKPKCTFNQYIKNYDNIPEKNNIDKINIRNYNNTNDNKCYIKISLHDFDIFCVHLDAYSELSRNIQLIAINGEVTRSSFIIGDFNFMNSNDFEFDGSKDELNYHILYSKNKNSEADINLNYNNVIKTLGWIDLSHNQCVPNFSQWSGTRVDFAFLANDNNNKKEGCNLYYVSSDASDHIPFIVDVKFDFNIIKPNVVVINDFLYNCQPFQDKSLKWVINKKFTHITDPFFTGNSEHDMILGANGMYLANSVLHAYSFGRTISSRYSDLPQNIHLLFINKKNNINNIKILSSGDNKYHGLQVDKYNDDYDIIEKGDGVTKYTPRSFDNDNGLFKNKFFDIISTNIIMDLQLNQPLQLKKSACGNDNKDICISKLSQKHGDNFNKSYATLLNKFNALDKNDLWEDLFEDMDKQMKYGILMLLELNNSQKEKFNKEGYIFNIKFDTFDFLGNKTPPNTVAGFNVIIVEYDIIEKIDIYRTKYLKYKHKYKNISN
jgi:endonuclease/exonuclease/phosphatase family metal-dependent hydrolase